jgi:threonine dehydrogenase-like Zn-dependent dehydrogenase
MGAFHTTPLHFRKALNLIASRAIDVKPLITRKMKLGEIGEAFNILATSKKEIKIAIIP